MKTEAVDKLRLVGYCRVSTDNQKEEGTIEIQERALREYAQTEGHDLLTIFKDEGVSGGLEDRPGLAELFNFLESDADIDGVLIFKLDRLARDMRIQENLIYDLQEKRHKRLVSIKEPDLDSKDITRVLFRQILGSISQYEKGMIALRLELGRMNKAKRGGYAGGATALGYRTKDKELRVYDRDAETVRSIFKMKRHRKMGLREIARELNEKGTPTARGGKWYAGTVKYVLENQLYKGALSYKDNTVKRADLALL